MDATLSHVLFQIRANPWPALLIPIITGSFSLAAALTLRNLKYPLNADAEPINEGVTLVTLQAQPFAQRLQNGIALNDARGHLQAQGFAQRNRDLDWVGWPVA